MKVLTRRNRQEADAVEYLQELDADQFDVGDYEARMEQPFLTRIVRPLGERSLKAISGLTPSNYLDSVHKKLLLAGMAGTVRAEEFVTAQAALTLFMGLLGAAIVLLTHPASNKAVVTCPTPWTCSPSRSRPGWASKAPWRWCARTSRLPWPTSSPVR
jgi:hypothetical protein